MKKQFYEVVYILRLKEKVKIIIKQTLRRILNTHRPEVETQFITHFHINEKIVA